MNAVMESLLEVIERDPLPDAYTSSYWKEFGRQAVIERRGGALTMRGVEFGAVYARNPVILGFHAVERLSYARLTRGLRSYPSVWRATKRLARELSFGLTFDVWKPAVVASLLLDHFTAHELRPRTFTVIGDGYGFLGALIRRMLPGVRIYCVDLPTTLLFQVRTHEAADPSARLALFDGDRQAAPGDVSFVLPQAVEQVPEAIDCAINIASMQEMNAFTVQTYFTFLRRRSTPRSRFYCVNRLRKELPGGEVASFYEFPWRADDEIFLDEPCPFYTHFIAPYTRPQGPRWHGVRVPFVNHFDGVHMQRLVRLAPESDGR